MKFEFSLSTKPEPLSSESTRRYIGRAFGSTHDAARALDDAATATHVKNRHFRLELERVSEIPAETPAATKPGLWELSSLGFLERIARSGRPVELADLQPNEAPVGISVSANEDDEDGVFVTGRDLEDCVLQLRQHPRFASV